MFGLTIEQEQDVFDPAAVAAANEAIRGLKRDLAHHQARVREIEAELARLYAVAGRRPGDGSDQPELFTTSSQARLW